MLRLGSTRIGYPHPSAITIRRENPRKMSDAEFAALEASIAQNGFKSFILVEEIAPGRYGIVDGHHRFKALNNLKAKQIPVMLLDPGADPGLIDLAMLSFNVTGSPNGAVYVEMLRELAERLGSEVVSKHVGIDSGMLEDMATVINDLMDQVSAGEESGAMGNHFGGTAFVGRPIKVEFVNTVEVRQLIEATRKKSGLNTDGEALIAAMRFYTEATQGDAELPEPAV